MQEEQPLADAPQRRAAELVGRRAALGNAVSQRPMLWIAMSENGSNVTLLSGANGDGPVVSDGVWQSPQPTAMKTARPARRRRRRLAPASAAPGSA